MIVKELIDLLSDLPQEYEVIFDFEEPSDDFSTEVDDDTEQIFFKNDY